MKEMVVSQSSPDLRRITVHADALQLDLVLPALVPVAVLIPSIVDMLPARGGLAVTGTDDPGAAPYRLCRLGAAALDASTTLAHNGIRDGSVLVLTRSPTDPPAPRFDDVAEAVSTTLDLVAWRWSRTASRLTAAVSAGWLAGVGGVLLARHALAAGPAVPARHIVTAVVGAASCVALFAAAVAHRTHRDAMAGLTLGLLATGFAATAGLLAVPGGPGAPNVLLAAMAAALASVVAMRVTGCGTATFTALSCFAVVIAGAALSAVVTGAPVHAVGAISAVASLGLLEAAARVSIVSSGLTPRLPVTSDVVSDDDVPSAADLLATKAIRANNWLTSLVAAFSGSAAIGAIGALTGVHRVGGPRVGGVLFATLTAACLLLRARSEADLTRTVVLVVTGTAAVSLAFIIPAVVWSQFALWIGALAVALAAVAVYLGFVAPTIAFSPLSRRVVELAEYLMLVAAVPVACWMCGVYGAVRGLSPI